MQVALKMLSAQNFGLMSIATPTYLHRSLLISNVIILTYICARLEPRRKQVGEPLQTPICIAYIVMGAV